MLARANSGQSAKSNEEVYLCAICSDTGWFVEPGKGAAMCECKKRGRREALLSKIPPEYRGLDLATITPDLNRHPKQAALIDAIQRDPGASLFLAGNNGTGKTMLGWLAYKRAIEQGRPAVFLSMPELLRQMRIWEMDSEKFPAVDAATLRESKKRWFVGIDEAEKARPSEFASEMLFQILDAIYTHRHQLVITSNLPQRALQEHWSRESPVYGASIIRRIVELDGLIEVSMFDGLKLVEAADAA